MKPISEWRYSMDRWCPAFLQIIIMLSILPLRLAICMILPADSFYKDHPLHRVKRFWGFK